MSILVKYDPSGRMGNRMFQYAFGKILALKKNQLFFAEHLPNFTNTFDGDHSKHTPPDYTFINPLHTRQKYGNHYVNMNELIHYQNDIIIDSFLQKYYYYIDHKYDIKQWFNLNITNNIIPKPNELVIHIREGDYNLLKTAIPYEYYIKTIKTLGFKTNTIITDECTSPTIQHLKNEGCQILSTKIVESFRTTCNNFEILDFYYMLKAKHLLISHSTFSWWAAFLGEQEHIFYPDVDNSMWKKQPNQDDIDLFIPNSNYIKI